MMKILMKTTLLVSLLAIGLGTTFASTTDELMLTVGGLTATITDNGGCAGTGCTLIFGDINPLAGTTTVSGSIGGWNIDIVSGTSYSPSDVPVGLALESLTATCIGGAANCATHSLDVQYSDTNFSPANPAFITGYSLTGLSGSGTTSESAYYSNSNALFAETALIGTVGPFTAVNSGSATGGTGSAAPYSLTLDQVFTDTGTASLSFGANGAISSVPEPGAVILFGTVLVFCASKLRRRRAS